MISVKRESIREEREHIKKSQKDILEWHNTVTDIKNSGIGLNEGKNNGQGENSTIVTTKINTL